MASRPFYTHFLIVIPFLAFTISLWRAAALLAIFSSLFAFPFTSFRVYPALVPSRVFLVNSPVFLSNSN